MDSQSLYKKNTLNGYIRKKLNRDLLTNPSAWMLVLSNSLVAAVVIYNNESILYLLWAYWIQSVIIGLFNFVRILTLKQFSTEGVEIGGSAKAVTKTSIAVFFLLHYGIFHLVYAGFLGSDLVPGNGTPLTMEFILLNGGIFFLNYFAEFIFKRNESKEVPNIGTVMFAPYKRIIPMHLTIMFAGFASILSPFFPYAPAVMVLIFFTVLKIIVDLITH